MGYQFYQLAEDVFSITPERINPGQNLPVPSLPKPADTIPRSRAIVRVENQLPTVNFIDVDFEVVEDRSSLLPVRYEGRPLSRAGQSRRSPKQLPPGGSGALTTALDIGYRIVSLTQRFIPPPCPELTTDQLAQILALEDQNVRAAIQAANSLEQLDAISQNVMTFGPLVVGAAAVLTGGAAVPAILAATPWFLGQRIAVSSLNQVTQHVVRNNAIHRARLSTSGVFEANPDADPCFEPPTLQLRRRLEDDCCECWAAIPESWAIKIGANRPQLLVLFARVFDDGFVGPPKYQLTIPHYQNLGPITQSPVGSYQHGRIRCLYELIDNSKIVVFAKSRSEGVRVIQQALSVINPFMFNSFVDEDVIATPMSNSRREFAEATFVPRIARYYSNGQRNEIPDWEVRF